MVDFNKFLERKYANLEAGTQADLIKANAYAMGQQALADSYRNPPYSPSVARPAAAIDPAAQIPLPTTAPAPKPSVFQTGPDESAAESKRLLNAANRFNLSETTPTWSMYENVQRRANGGLIEKFSNGRLVPETPQNPLYQNYLKALARANMQAKAMPEEAFMRSMAQLDSQRRMAMAPQTNMGGTMGFAQGGAVDVGGMQVLGPGHGKSDSIPAVIDGQRPAALSTGEFIFPKKVVDYYGTKFLDAMVSKARQALKEKQYA